MILVKLQTLRQEFKVAHMKGSESVQSYVSRMVTIVNQMRIYGEKISNQTAVAKLSRSLTARFDHIVAAIEEAKGINILSVDELSGSLQAHEARLNRTVEKSEETAFHVKGESSTVREGDKAQFRGRGRANLEGRN